MHKKYSVHFVRTKIGRSFVISGQRSWPSELVSLCSLMLTAATGKTGVSHEAIPLSDPPGFWLQIPGTQNKNTEHEGNDRLDIATSSTWHTNRNTKHEGSDRLATALSLINAQSSFVRHTQNGIYIVSKKARLYNFLITQLKTRCHPNGT